MVYLSEDKWRRLVKNSRCANQNIGWGQRVVKRDKYVGVSQLLWGTCSGCPPKVYAYGEDDTNTLRDVFIHVCDPKKDDNYELVKSCYPFNTHSYKLSQQRRFKKVLKAISEFCRHADYIDF